MEKEIFRLLVSTDSNMASDYDYNLIETKCEECIKMFSKVGDSIELVFTGSGISKTLVKRYANKYHYGYTEFYADKSKYGKAAWYERNKQSHEYVKEGGNGCVIAFWNGEPNAVEQNIKLASKIGVVKRIVPIGLEE